VAIDHHDPGSQFLDRRLLLVKDNVTVVGTFFMKPDSATPAVLPSLPDYASFMNDTDIEFGVLPDPNAPSTIALAKIVGSTPTSVTCEAVPFAREKLPSGEFRAVFPGWRESENCAALLFDGRPFWTSADEAQAKWNRLKVATKIRVTGALVYDCFLIPKDECPKHLERLEIHPIYSIALLDRDVRPTGL
jgi:hypothetical protein